MEDAISIKEIEASKAKLKQIGSTLRFLFLVLAVLAFMAWLAIIASIISAAIKGVGGSGADDGLRAGLASLVMLVLALAFLILSGMFADIAKGRSPFVPKQAKRLRFVALCLFVLFLLDVVIPEGTSVIRSGQYADLHVSDADETMIGFNPLILSCSIFFFALSFVFKYGSLLQSLSDDTV